MVGLQASRLLNQDPDGILTLGGLIFLYFIAFLSYLIFTVIEYESSVIKRLIRGKCDPKLYIPSTLNIDLLLWHTQLIMCAVK